MLLKRDYLQKNKSIQLQQHFLKQHVQKLPAPETYLGALKLLEGKPAETIMVAVHNYDLLAAASHGLRTAFVRRPLEWGGQQPTEEADHSVDMAVETLVDLAERLGC